MANVPLQDIQFPGLDNTYTVLQIDAGLNTAGKAADSKAAGDAIAAAEGHVGTLSNLTTTEKSSAVGAINELNAGLATKAEAGGEVDTLTAGTALQLDSKNKTVDQVPYVFRMTPTGAGTRKRETVVGGTVDWNQLARNGNFASTLYVGARNGSVSVSDNVLTVTPTVDGTLCGAQVQTDRQITAGHKLFLTIDVKPPITTTVSFSIQGSNGVSISVTSGQWNSIAIVYEMPAAGLLSVLYALLAGSVTTSQEIQYRRAMVIDLTAMFGTAIADYIYGLETAHAGDGVALFRSLFPNDYYEYNAGSLESVQVSAHKTYDAENNMIASYPLDDSVTLRGIWKLGASNNLYCDGDTYESDGTVTRRYGIVDFGTLTWNYDTSNKRWVAASGGILKPTGNIRGDNVFAEKYVTDVDASVGDDGKTFTYNSNFYVTMPTNATQPSGYAIFELATPTTESAAPFVPVMAVDPDGTEEYIDAGVTASTPTRDVSIPAGHYSEYPTDQVAKLDSLPSDFSTLIAPVEKTFVASQNYTSGALLIVNNVLYKVTANIANGGTITPGTNVTATTLAAVIAALS